MIKNIRNLTILAVMTIFVAIACSQSPSEVYERKVQALVNQNWSEVYDFHCESSQEQLVDVLKFVLALDDDLESMVLGGKKAEQLSEKEIFIKVMSMMSSDEIFTEGDIEEVIDEKIIDDRAVLTIKLEKDGEKDTTEVEMVLENGLWKIVHEDLFSDQAFDYE
ncbi:hypothetical protein CHISP_3338 [Chitinispirillum alkaliphilum]|nr:hypothetical protein CHISP_3338 [Chitinispirillum alkaliphilum]